MLEYWVQMFAKAIVSMPEFLGSNWRGFALTCCAIAIPQIKEIRKNGFGFSVTRQDRVRYVGRLVMRHWRENAEITIVITVLFFGGHFLDVVYRDRTDLFTKAGQLDTLKRNETGRINESTQPLKNQIDLLKTECAVKDGINQTLEKQNRDEQILIAGCQAEAIKRLVPPELKITPLVFEADNSNVTIRTIRWLVLTNKPFQTLHVAVECTGTNYIDSASVRAIGNETGFHIGGGNGRLGPTAWELRDTGVWTPEVPILVTLGYRGGSGDIVCSFIPR